MALHSPDDVVERFAMASPSLRANMVMSLDGASTVGSRVGPLTGPADQRHLHTLRALADVLLVGASTVRAEGYGPLLFDAERQGMRRRLGLAPTMPLAIVTRAIDLDLDSSIFTRSPARPIVLTSELAPPEVRARAERRADVLVLGETDCPVDRVVDALRERGLGRILCEGGPTLLAQLIAAGLLDELCLTLSPKTVGPQALSLTAGSAVPAGAWGLVDLFVEDDYLFTRYRRAD